MSIIGKLSIPVGANIAPLATDLDAASSRIDRWTQRTAARPPVTVPVKADVRHFEKGMGSAVKLGKSAANEVARNFAEQAVAEKVLRVKMPSLGAFGAAKMGIDAGADKAASVTLRVASTALKADLAVCTGILKGGVKAMTGLALVPIKLGTLLLKASLGVAEAILFAKIKQWTGMSTVQMVVAYAAFKVSLAVTKRLLATAVSGMVRVATVPFRVALGALRAGLRAARALVSAAARQMAHLASVPFKVAGAGLGIGLVGTALGGLVGVPAAIAGSVKAASDLNETVSKVGYTFGESSAIVIKGADAMAAALGVPKREFLDAASSVGLVGKAAGMTQAQAAELGVRFARAGADASSFFNIPYEEVLEKLRSGLVGEAEPMRALGVLLSETAVKAKAVEMGIGKAKGELDESTKVMARAALITDGLKTSQGDLSRTSAALANRAREVWGRIQNLAATLGGFLLPAAQSVSAAFAELATSLTAKVEGAKATFEAWGQSIKRAADMLGVFFRNFSVIKDNGKVLLADVGKNLWANIKPVLTYLVDYAKYFANVLGQAIEAAVQNALDSVLRSSRLTAHLAPGRFVKNVDYLPPKAPQLPGFQPGDEAKGVLAVIKAREVVNDLINKARDLAHPREAPPAAAAVKNPADDLQASSAANAKVHANREKREKPKPAAGPEDKARGMATALGAMKVLANLNAGIAGGLGGMAGMAGPAGAIVPAVVSQAVSRAMENARPEPKFAQGAEEGSKEAYSAIIRHNAGDRDRNETKTIAKNSERQVKLLQRIADRPAGGLGNVAVLHG